MNHRRWLTWLIFAVCALAVVEGLGWVTWQSLKLERRERDARVQARLQELVRLALWRMESEITPILAQEASRPYFQYQAFYPAERAYTRMWEEVQPGEVLVPSPLLEGGGPYTRLYFQIQADGMISSPQAPTGAMRQLAESKYVDPELLLVESGRLDELRTFFPSSASRAQSGAVPDAVRRVMEHGDDQQRAEGEVQMLSQLDAKVTPQQSLGKGYDSETLSKNEYLARRQSVDSANVSQEQNRSKQFAQAPPPPPPAPQAAPAPTQVVEAPHPQAMETGAPSTPAAAPGTAQPVPISAEPSDAPAANKPGSAPGGGGDRERELREGPEKKDGSIKAGDVSRDKDAAGLASGLAKADGPVFRLPAPGAAAGGERPLSPAYTEAATPSEVRQSGFEPVWVVNPATSRRELLLQRRVELPGGVVMTQGMWMDWMLLRQRLLAVSADLLPGASIKPITDRTEAQAPSALLMASIPAVVVPGSVTPAAIGTIESPRHATLILTWAAVLGGIAAIAIVLRKSMDLSDRRGRFVSAVTHELRTPLTTFCLYTEMLETGMVPPDASRGYLRTLHEQSRRLAGIVENVLEYARLGGRRIGSHIATVDGAELLERVRPALEACVDRCGMSLDLRVLPDAAGQRVVADPATVERILINLVDNACKYASDGPDLRVHVALAAAERPGALEFRVRDHGPGVPKGEERRIFLPFQRGAQASDGSKSGLGLGLALARGLARQMGGDLTLGRPAENEALAGAEFRLRLRAATTRP